MQALALKFCLVSVLAGLESLLANWKAHQALLNTHLDQIRLVAV